MIEKTRVSLNQGKLKIMVNDFDDNPDAATDDDDFVDNLQLLMTLLIIMLLLMTIL